ncbi:MAG: hypothetical protein BMS9Abin28_2609 [Anaerolineae bacterium]|nr:MAG: hypothetical protein BMS9Abin28_2609 [Anaerolineae bacterium]
MRLSNYFWRPLGQRRNALTVNDAGGSGLQVEQRLDADSETRPLAFIWRGTRWIVNSVGRTWESDGERHYLVMVQGDRVFELAHSGTTGSWRMVRRPEDFGPNRKAT